MQEDFCYKLWELIPWLVSPQVQDVSKTQVPKRCDRVAGRSTRPSPTLATHGCISKPVIRFITIYDDTPETILQPQHVLDQAAIRSLLGKVRAGGCTNLSGGWLMGSDHVKSQQATERINRVLLLTDGQANAGISDTQILINPNFNGFARVPR